jgi:opacity protein-like surface antigen
LVKIKNNLKIKNMKKLVALLAILSISFAANAQDQGSILLKAYGGYTFSDKVEFDNGYVDVGSGFQWGGGLEFFVQKTSSIELKYVTMATSLSAYEYSYLGGNGQINPNNDSGNTSYLLADFTHYFDNGGKVTPYLGGGLGWGFVSAPNTSTDGFAWDLKLGAKIKTGSAFTVNLEAYLQSMSEAVGTDYYYYWGYYYPVTDYASTLQFGLGAVLCYDFKAKK